MTGKNSKSQSFKFITQEDIQEQKNSLRRTPLSHKYYSNPLQSQNLGRHCVTHENGKKQKAVSHIDESVLYCIKQLNEKENKHVLQLKILKKKLEQVCSGHCGKILPMTAILDFHVNTLSRRFVKCSDVLDIPKVFIKYKTKFQMYSDFARNKSDFSYIVVDLCECVIDLLKARLLEYNFTLSQIKSICSDNYEMKTICEEAENVIKEVYYKVNYVLIEQENQQ